MGPEDEDHCSPLVVFSAFHVYMKLHCSISKFRQNASLLSLKLSRQVRGNLHVGDVRLIDSTSTSSSPQPPVYNKIPSSIQRLLVLSVQFPLLSNSSTYLYCSSLLSACKPISYHPRYVSWQSNPYYSSNQSRLYVFQFTHQFQCYSLRCLSI